MTTSIHMFARFNHTGLLDVPVTDQLPSAKEPQRHPRGDPTRYWPARRGLGLRFRGHVLRRS
jgi:hypothetical protein